MVDPDVVTAKLSELASRLSRVQESCPDSSSRLASDPDALDLISFNLMLSVQTCLAVASHIIADEGWRPAATLAESFHRLGEHGVISNETAQMLGRAAGLRDLVAHGYSQVNTEMLFLAATEGLEDLQRYAAEISSWLAGQLA